MRLRLLLQCACVVGAALAVPVARAQEEEPPAPPAFTSQEPLGAYEEAALARYKELRAINAAYDLAPWAGFFPLPQPALFVAPDGVALAVGFPEQPAGFNRTQIVTDPNQPVYRGTFADGGASPALVGSVWAVVSRLEPAPLPVRDLYGGRRATEEVFADFAGDSFLIFLMKQRKRTSPFTVGAAGYPDSAELIALTTLEEKTLLRALQMQFDEKTADEFHKNVRNFIAVRRARWNLMGPDLAAIERAIESTEGLRMYHLAMVHRNASSNSFQPARIASSDASFGRWNNSLLLRLELTNYPLMLTQDGPVPSSYQVAARGGSVGFLLDRVSRTWYDAATTGDKSLVDLLAEVIELKPEDEAARLADAKATFYFDTILKLAEADLKLWQKRREELLAKEFPAGPSRLEVHLNGSRVPAYQEDPATVGLLGGGAILHRGALSVSRPGLTLQVERATEGSGARLLTQAKARRDELTGIVLSLPQGVSPRVGGAPYEAGKRPRQLSSGDPLVLEAPGLKMRLEAGSLSALPGGGLRVELP